MIAALCNRYVLFFGVSLAVLLLVFVSLHGNMELVELGAAQGGGSMRGLVRNEMTTNACQQSYGHYSGPLWSKEGETGGRKCLLESARMRVDHHVRILPNGDKIDDWLWIDYGDRVNVLVRERAVDGEEGKFVVLEQTKYALVGSSLSVVGGFIEPDETAEAAALREVLEELQLKCETENLTVFLAIKYHGLLELFRPI